MSTMLLTQKTSNVIPSNFIAFRFNLSHELNSIRHYIDKCFKDNMIKYTWTEIEAAKKPPNKRTK